MARYRAVPLAVMIPQLFLGVAWTRSAIAHTFESDWWNGEQVVDFVADSDEIGLPFYTFLAELIFEPLASQFAIVVVVVQATLGLLLLANIRPRMIALGSIFLSMNFTMGGQVNPSVFYIILALVVLFRLVDNKPATATWKTFSLQATVLLVLVLLLCGPFVRTLQPVDLIDDPALILITLVSIFAVSSWGVYLRLMWFPEAMLAARSGSEHGRFGGDVSNLADELKSIAVHVDDLAARVVANVDPVAAEDVASDSNDESTTDVEVAVVEDREDGGEVEEVEDGEEVGHLDETESEQPEADDVIKESRLDDLSDGLVIVDRKASVAVALPRVGTWFSVRCHFQLAAETYEERITIWCTEEFEDALELAEQEARDYAAGRDGRYLESCDGYRMSESAMTAKDGQQIYSLVRTSTLTPAAYLRQFFFTGAEQSLYA